jgi:hypothetical protein
MAVVTGAGGPPPKAGNNKGMAERINERGAMAPRANDRKGVVTGVYSPDGPCMGLADK